jgi:hypothetical protein
MMCVRARARACVCRGFIDANHSTITEFGQRDGGKPLKTYLTLTLVSEPPKYKSTALSLDQPLW